jgi:hypothetical protein
MYTLISTSFVLFFLSTLVSTHQYCLYQYLIRSVPISNVSPMMPLSASHLLCPCQYCLTNAAFISISFAVPPSVTFHQCCPFQHLIRSAPVSNVSPMLPLSAPIRSILLISSHQCCLYQHLIRSAPVSTVPPMLPFSAPYSFCPCQ